MYAELNLILEIEKHQCLYNFHLIEYSRKDITEKAWGEVAAKTQLSGNFLYISYEQPRLNHQLFILRQHIIQINDLAMLKSLQFIIYRRLSNR